MRIFYSGIAHKLQANEYKHIETQLLNELFSEISQLAPEQQSRLEEYNVSSRADDFKMTLKSLASQLDQSGKTHIILVDEVDLVFCHALIS